MNVPGVEVVATVAIAAALDVAVNVPEYPVSETATFCVAPMDVSETVDGFVVIVALPTVTGNVVECPS